MNIDTHSHYWPKSFLQAMHSGKDFFGWKPEKVGGKLAISLGETTLTFPVPETDLDDLDTRYETRNAYQPISMEALQIVGFLWCQHLDETVKTVVCRLYTQSICYFIFVFPFKFY